MDPITGGLIAAGGSMLGGFLGRNAAKKRANEQKDLYRQSLGLYQNFLNDPNSYLNRGESAMKGAVGTLNRGFLDAKRNLSMAGQNAKQTTVTGGNQALAGMQQSMISRGLYGTTALDNAQRGISSDVSRRLAQIDEEVGSMYANLATQRAGAVAGAQQALGGFYGQAQGSQQNALENYINLLRDKPQSFNSTAFFGNALSGGIREGLGVYGMLKGQG